MDALTRLVASVVGSVARVRRSGVHRVRLGAVSATVGILLFAFIGLRIAGS
jgi:hypothetical protein